MSEPQASSTPPLRLGQIPQSWEIGFGRGTALEQVQQRRDRRGREPEQHQGCRNVTQSRRNAMPNGTSVRIVVVRDAVAATRGAPRGDLPLDGRGVRAGELARAHDHARRRFRSRNRTSGGPVSSSSAGSIR